MISGNRSNFIGHPLSKDSISAHGPPTTLGPRTPHHLNPALSQMNVVSNEVVSNECGLKWMWSQMTVISNEVVSNECGLKWMNVVSNECGLKWMWSQMTVISNKCGLKWLWSQMNVVSNERGLIWMWSQMNVVSNEKVLCERGIVVDPTGQGSTHILGM